ncbi:hypothetical protein EJB05_36844, partial [Eragrostis curvula]
MSRALLLRRLLPGGALPFSPTAASSSRAVSSYTYSSRRASHSTAASTAQPEAAGAAQAGAAEAGAGEQGASAPPPAARGRWGLLKFGALAAVSAALSGIGYVSYAYSLDEVEEKTREFRKKSAPTLPEDASEFEKFKAKAYSTAMKVPVAAIELYLDVRSTIEDHVQGFTEPTSDKLLPDLLPEEKHVFTLVLDLNETLVYSDWQRERGWRTFKRPGVDAFVEHMAQYYEVVVFSDQPPMYVDPVLDRLDTKGYIRFRLSRPATKYKDGKHFRDLSKLNRNPAQVIYISAHCFDSCLQPENCVQVRPWKLENDDTQLVDLIPFLECLPTLEMVLASYQGHDVAKEFLERSKEHQ